MDTTHTTFGTVVRNGSETTIHWANRGDNRWPCSELARLDEIRVAFDSRGDLVGIEGDEEYMAPSDELDAWSSECLIRAGYPNHPAIRPSVQS